MSKKRRSTDSGDESNLPEDTDANEPSAVGGDTPPVDALRVANLQDTPPNDSQTEPVHSPVGASPGTVPDAPPDRGATEPVHSPVGASPGTVPGSAIDAPPDRGAIEEAETRERFRSASREEKLLLLISLGGLTVDEAQALSAEDLDYRCGALGEQLQREEQQRRQDAPPEDGPTTTGTGGTPRAATLGAPVAAQSAVEPIAMRVATELRSKSREDKIALLAARTNLDVREAAALTPEDLDFHARAVLEQDTIAADAAEKMRGTDPNAPSVGDPYGNDKPQHYAVTENLRPLLIDGGMIQLRAGEIITDRTHNIPELRKYGAKLVPCAPPEPYLQR